MAARVINILLMEDDEVDVMNIKPAFKKVNLRRQEAGGTHGLSRGIQAIMDIMRNALKA